MTWDDASIVTGLLILLGLVFAGMEILYARVRNQAGENRLETGAAVSRTDNPR